MQRKKHVIWQDLEVDIKDFEEILEQDYPDVTDEYEKQRICAEINEEYLQDEKSNLSGICVPNGIFVIADLGLWSGRHNGWLRNELSSVAECLEPRCSSMSYNEFYVEGCDLKQRETHHDGTNYYVYRAWKEKTTARQKEVLKDAIYNNEPPKKVKGLITRYTTGLGREIGKVYGWVA